MTYLPPIPTRPPPDENLEENVEKASTRRLFCLMHVIGKLAFPGYLAPAARPCKGMDAYIHKRDGCLPLKKENDE